MWRQDPSFSFPHQDWHWDSRSQGSDSQEPPGWVSCNCLQGTEMPQGRNCNHSSSSGRQLRHSWLGSGEDTQNGPLGSAGQLTSFVLSSLMHFHLCFSLWESPSPSRPPPLPSCAGFANGGLAGSFLPRCIGFRNLCSLWGVRAGGAVEPD